MSMEALLATMIIKIKLIMNDMTLMHPDMHFFPLKKQDNKKQLLTYLTFNSFLLFISVFCQRKWKRMFELFSTFLPELKLTSLFCTQLQVIGVGRLLQMCQFPFRST